ncbi:hypothetical protein QUB80_14185 [Chlorogloeopsis sp. ULAP01]|uniref:hypothetical protein n=1 Tax=Chlorogloeopsis sp. ULAP01 TaxID=3056483 RepID=UPI0025AAA0AF|nr:hypothetical protein [Chlorogloeopsis sp. ULAP01]MDM9381849.1 hypothetical protein [Chlorogloeopsis sp. ULAP01]
MNKKGQIFLVPLLITNVVITISHYTDNAIFIDRYPAPEWISYSYRVYMAWIILTLIGVVGYLLYRKGILRIAYLFLGIYSLTGLFSPGHYFYGEMSKFSLKMHTLIWFDFIAGLSIIGFITWSGLILKEWQKGYVSN